MTNLERLKKYGFDPQIQARARRYQQDRLFLKASCYAALLALFLLFARFGSAELAAWIRGFAPSLWLQNALYTVIFTLGLLLVGLLFDWQSYRIEQRYGLSTQPPYSWLADKLRGGAINLILFLFALPGIYIGIERSGLWWLIAWAITTFFFILMSFITPVVLLPLFFKFAPLEDEELVGRLKGLAERAQVKIIGVFKMAAGVKTKKAIGALAGLGSTRRIILSDTLLENYTPDEIETVIAHELGHHLHQDIWKVILSFSAMALLGFLVVHLTLEPFAWAFGLGKGIESLPLFLVVLGGVFLLLMPFYNTFSRWFEGQADQFALELARKPGAQAQLGVKLCDQNLRYAAPHPLVEFLFYDHPAGIKRVERAIKFRQVDK